MKERKEGVETFRRPAIGFALLFFALAAGVGARHPDEGQAGRYPSDVGRFRELFLDDDFLVESKSGIEAVPAQAIKLSTEPVLKQDQPWELSGPDAYVDVLYDEEERLYKMWYDCKVEVQHYHGTPSQERAVGYAISEDGIRWKKPALTAVTDKPTNLVFFGFGGKKHGVPYVVKDYSDPDPVRRYKMLFNFWDFRDRGLGYAWSADGIHWEIHRFTVIQGGFDTLNIFFWDNKYGCWVAYTRIRIAGKRSIARATSPDLQHWSLPVAVETPDELDGPDEHLYTPGCFRLTNARDVYVMVTGVHDQVKNILTPQLGVSRDGIHWRRFRKPFIPFGPKGAWDSGGGRPSGREVPSGDKLLFYYRGVEQSHGENPREGIGVAQIGRDRFVGLRAAGHGQVTTRTVRLNYRGRFQPENGVLLLNATARNGSVRVEVLDEKGQVIPGFSAQDCLPLTEDGVDQPVRWSKQPTLQPVVGRPVRLRFLLENATIFAFQIVETSDRGLKDEG
ncbi:MAG: hypothetical protein HXY20_10580 [Acidobacteria bacterium]|nr:hypothetical protein [Acidobacteriota bacterium]